MRATWQPLYLISAGALLCAFAVALGAFGAHVFRQILNEPDFDTFRTGVEYQFLHALGMIASGMLARSLRRSRACAWAGFAFLAGILLFSFSLYALSVFGQKWLGAVAPAGGLAFMLGWLLLVWAAQGGWSDTAP